jgi:large subunit ribosomal protein L15
MLTLNTLKPNPGTHKETKRLGRGTASGQGKTSGRGENGAGARSGTSNKLFFEGGQTPLTRRIPKRGFISPFKIDYQVVNVGLLQKLEVNGKDIDVHVLYEKGIVGSSRKPVKILGAGELSKSFNVKASAFSQSAKEKIEKAKGKIEVVRGA